MTILQAILYYFYMNLVLAFAVAVDIQDQGGRRRRGWVLATLLFSLFGIGIYLAYDSVKSNRWKRK